MTNLLQNNKMKKKVKFKGPCDIYRYPETTIHYASSAQNSSNFLLIIFIAMYHYIRNTILSKVKLIYQS